MGLSELFNKGFKYCLLGTPREEWPSFVHQRMCRTRSFLGMIDRSYKSQRHNFSHGNKNVGSTIGAILHEIRSQPLD